jgi:hypothetical protein
MKETKSYSGDGWMRKEMQNIKKNVEELGTNATVCKEKRDSIISTKNNISML